MTAKLGRNAPCHCGSGTKYKRCCLRREEAEAIEAKRVVVPRGRPRRGRMSATTAAALVAMINAGAGR